jgi:hypothetical protein
MTRATASFSTSLFLCFASGCSGEVVDGAVTAPSSPTKPSLAVPTQATPGSSSFALTEASLREASQRAEWKRQLQAARTTQRGCFQASYPDASWTEVPCLDVDILPNLPARVAAPRASSTMSLSPAPPLSGQPQKGVALQASSAQSIYALEGSFWLVDNLTKIYGPRYKNSCSDVQYGDNNFGYQLNSNYFHDPHCPGGTPGAACGWQQFVFNNRIWSGLDGWVAGIYVWSWLLGQTSCPSGWSYLSIDTELGHGACSRRGSVTPVAPQTFQTLSTTYLQGWLDFTNSDVVFFAGGSAGYRAVSDAIPSFSGQWTQGEFNVYGSACGGNVDLPGAALGPQVKIISQWAGFDSVAAPTPVSVSHTGETNGMYVVPGSLCPRPGAHPNGDDQGSVRGLQASTDRSSQPQAPFCLLNDISPLSMLLR